MSSFCNPKGASPRGFKGVDFLGNDRPGSIALAIEVERDLQCDDIFPAAYLCVQSMCDP